MKCLLGSVVMVLMLSGRTLTDDKMPAIPGVLPGTTPGKLTTVVDSADGKEVQVVGPCLLPKPEFDKPDFQKCPDSFTCQPVSGTDNVCGRKLELDDCGDGGKCPKFYECKEAKGGKKKCQFDSSKDPFAKEGGKDDGDVEPLPPPDAVPGELTPTVDSATGKEVIVMGPCLGPPMPGSNTPEMDRCPPSFICQQVNGSEQCGRHMELDGCVNDECPNYYECKEVGGKKKCIFDKTKDPLGATRKAASSETPMPNGGAPKRILGANGKPDLVAEKAASLGIDISNLKAPAKAKNALGKTRKAASSETPIGPKDPVPAGGDLHHCATYCGNAGVPNFTYCRDDDDCHKNGATKTPELTRATAQMMGAGNGEPWRPKKTYDKDFCWEDGNGPEEYGYYLCRNCPNGDASTQCLGYHDEEKGLYPRMEPNNAVKCIRKRCCSLPPRKSGEKKRLAGAKKPPMAAIEAGRASEEEGTATEAVQRRNKTTKTSVHTKTLSSRKKSLKVRLKKGDKCSNGGVFSGVFCTSFHLKFNDAGNGRCMGRKGLVCLPEEEICCTIPNEDKVLKEAKFWAEGQAACSKIDRVFAEKECPTKAGQCGVGNTCHEGKCCKSKDSLSDHCGPNGHYLGTDCDSAKNCGLKLILTKGAVCTNSLCCGFSDPTKIPRRMDTKLLNMGEALCRKQGKTFTGQFCPNTPKGRTVSESQKRTNAKVCEGHPKLPRSCADEGFCCEADPLSFKRPYV